MEGHGDVTEQKDIDIEGLVGNGWYDNDSLKVRRPFSLQL